MGRGRLCAGINDPMPNGVDPIRQLPAPDARAEHAAYDGWSDQPDVAAAGQLLCRHLRLVRGRQVASQRLAAVEPIGINRWPCSYIEASGAGSMAYEAHWVRAKPPIEASQPSYPGGSTATVPSQALGSRSRRGQPM